VVAEDVRAVGNDVAGFPRFFVAGRFTTPGTNFKPSTAVSAAEAELLYGTYLSAGDNIEVAT
jgi:hypothetical protein